MRDEITPDSGQEIRDIHDRQQSGGTAPWSIAVRRSRHSDRRLYRHARLIGTTQAKAKMRDWLGVSH
jgi:hypothetical protein